MAEELVQREITQKDWNQVEKKVKDELSRRENDQFRKDHEVIWKEVDRQINMKAVEPYNRSKTDWHSAIELGELAKASEILGADVMRLAFPNTRAWFEAHVELPPTLDEQTGENTAPTQKEQVFIDGICRALMSQQHQDFGFKSRFGLSVKEALHHGSFVAEVRGEDATMFHDTGGIESVHSPVWVPHSMWNCYPDPSPSVIGSNMFYTGSMIIREFMPMYKLRSIAENGVDEGWMPSQLKKVPKRGNKNKDVETNDVEIIKWFGDMVIDKKDGDIYLPNSKIMLANGIIVFYAPNRLPFPPILFNGYERLDVRDPYFTSPLIKLAPMHKVASTLANKFIDNISLHVEPPGQYDANDPGFTPNFAPGSMEPTKYMGKGVNFYDIGDPNAALLGLQAALEQLRSGTSVDSIRSGGGESADSTATEIRAKMARGEVRVVDFVDKLEFSLKTFLYMQHHINKSELQSYGFYNPEMDAPDFMRLGREDIQYNVHFDVVGARGVLGEEERSQKMSAVTAFASGNQLFAPLLKPVDLLKEMYLDAGVKNPERFLVVQDDEFEQIVQQVEQKYQEMIEAGKQEIYDLKEELAIKTAVNDAKVAEATQKAQAQAEISQFKAEIQAQLEMLKGMIKVDENEAKSQKTINDLVTKLQQMELKFSEKEEKEEKSEKKTPESITINIDAKQGKVKKKLTRTESGYEIEEE